MKFSKDSEEFSGHVPDHECIGLDCTIPHAFYIMAYEHIDSDGDEAIAQVMGMHNVSAPTVAATFIHTVEAIYLENKPDDMPAFIAMAMARKMMRDMIDSTPMVGGEVAQDISDAIHRMIAESGNE